MLFFTWNPYPPGDRENLQCEYELAGCSLWGPRLPASAVDDKMHCILSQYKPDFICSPISQRNDIFIRAAWSHRHQRHSRSWLGGLWELTEAVLPLPAHYCSSLRALVYTTKLLYTENLWWHLFRQTKWFKLMTRMIPFYCMWHFFVYFYNIAVCIY